MTTMTTKLIRGAVLASIAALSLAQTASAAWDGFLNQQVLASAGNGTSSQQVMWPGGIGVMAAQGTFSGATVTLQALGPDGVTQIAAGSNTTCTSSCMGVFYLPRGIIQVTVSAGSGASIFASVGVVQHP